MIATALFCIAEDAKPFVHRILADGAFYFIQSRNLLGNPSGLTILLLEGQEFETEFTGASQQDCQEWVLEEQEKVTFIEKDMLVIADERTSRDGTILVQWYNRENGHEFPTYGILPKEKNTWYDFRIDSKAYRQLHAALKLTNSELVYPSYFGCKEELTDENGVFNVIEATRDLIGEEASAFSCLYFTKNTYTGLWE